MAKSGIERVLLVTGANGAGEYMRLLKNGQELGLRSLTYAFQDGAGGIAHALALAESFVGGEPFLLILGDNLVEHTLEGAVRRFASQKKGARVLLSPVESPRAFGIAEIEGERITRIVEKPKEPRATWPSSEFISTTPMCLRSSSRSSRRTGASWRSPT